MTGLLPTLDEWIDKDWARGAEFSPCRTWRYRLWSRWDRETTLVWLMCNPSVADEHKLDPTLRKVDGFTKRLGFGGWIVVNLFAFVSTDPKGLRRSDIDTVGPDNDAAIREACQRHSPIVCAWGRVGGVHRQRVEHVLGMIDHHDLVCLGRSKEGHPRHPLMLAYSTPMEPFES